MKGCSREPLMSSVPHIPTRASHGTKLMAPEALAEEYGGKEWKHFMSDTGMACRSGMAHVGQRHHSLPFCFEPWICYVRTQRMVSLPPRHREQLQFYRNRICVFPHMSYLSLTVGSVLFKVFVDFLLCSGIKRLALRNNTFLSCWYFLLVYYALNLTFPYSPFLPTFIFPLLFSRILFFTSSSSIFFPPYFKWFYAFFSCPHG